MYLSEQLENKWSPVLDHDGLNKIKDPYRRAVTAMVLENQEKAMSEAGYQQLRSNSYQLGSPRTSKPNCL